MSHSLSFLCLSSLRFPELNYNEPAIFEIGDNIRKRLEPWYDRPETYPCLTTYMGGINDELQCSKRGSPPVFEVRTGQTVTRGP